MSKGKQTTFNVTPVWALFFIFLVLKLTGFITWSWWWVFSPFWGIFVLSFIYAFSLLFIAIYNEWKKDKARRK